MNERYKIFYVPWLDSDYDRNKTVNVLFYMMVERFYENMKKA
jgi:hypothetical protein